MLVIPRLSFYSIITRLWYALHRLPIKSYLLWIGILVAVVVSVEGAMANEVKNNEILQQTDRFIIKFKSSVRQKGIDQTIEQRLSYKLGLTLKKLALTGNEMHVFELPEMMDLQTVYAMTQQLSEDGLIEYAEPDRIVLPKLTPNDEYYQNQWHYHDNTQVIGGINLPMAWNISTGSENMVIAVIDTGILPHSDLTERMVSGYDMISSTRIGADGNGRDNDPTDVGDWTEQDACYQGSSASRSTWHGTHVAGTLGAVSNNGIGVAGVNWKAKIMSIRAMGKCGGYMSDIADSIRWAAGADISNIPNTVTPAKVINLSLGGVGNCGYMEQQAINEAVQLGAIVVVAAGNESGNVAQSTPANCQYVISVAAVTASGAQAYYSNIGEKITVAAPGGNWSKGIMSTFNRGDTLAETQSYQSLMGTSMAAPHVAGVISLMLSVNPLLSLNDVRRIIEETARDFPVGTIRDCDKLRCGAGIIDAAKALMMAGNNRPPMVSVTSAQRVNGGDRVLLQGSAYDVDGQVNELWWSQISGEQVSLLEDDGSFGAENETLNERSIEKSVYFVAPELPQRLGFRFTANDDKKALSSTDIHVEINMPPMANAGGDQVVLPKSLIVLDGSNSTDDLAIKQYHWRQSSGNTVMIDYSLTETAEFVAPSLPGAIEFTLRVEDEGNLFSEDSMTVYVNEKPIARAGTDQLVNAKNTVYLDGSESADSDGAIQSYRWRQRSGRPVKIIDARLVMARFVAPDDIETLVFELTVVDNLGFSSTDIVTVNMNRPPITVLSESLWVTVGQRVLLSGADSYDLENEIVAYQWRQIAGEPVILTDATQALVNFQVPSMASVLVFELTVTDSAGLSAYHLTSIVVNEHVSSLRGKEGSVLPGEFVNLSSFLADAQVAKVSAYQWKQLVGVQAELKTLPSGAVTFLASEKPGLLIFQVIADYSDGTQSLGVVQVDVINVAPRFLLPETFVVTQGEALSFNVEVSDANQTQVRIIADILPEHAVFDQQTGGFFWDGTHELGEYRVRFIGFDSLLSSLQTIHTVKISVVSPGQLQFSESQVRVQESASEVRISLQRMAGFANDVAVDVVLQAGSAQTNDYVFVTEQVQWPAEDSSPKQINIPIVNDTLAEQDESFFLYLANPQGGATIGDLNAMQIVIGDDDRSLSGAVLFKQASLQVTEGQAVARISLIRQEGSQGTLRVDYQTFSQTAQENSDYQPVSGTLVWSQGSDAEQFFSIPIVDDNKAENDENLLVELQIHWAEINAGINNPITKTSSLVIKDNDPRCFIATAAYGSGMAPEVRYLRAFRDDYLLPNSVGNQLVDWYYQYSPPLADYLRSHPILRAVVRAGLQPLIAMSQWLSNAQSYRLQTASKP